MTYTRPGTLAVIAVTAVVTALLTTAGLAALEHRRAVRATAVAESQPLAHGPGLPNWVAVAAAVQPSVVSVHSGSTSGSGVVLDTAGRIVTNAHLVTGAGPITVALADGRLYPATPAGADPASDLAVLRLTGPPGGLKPAAFGTSATLQAGDPVLVAGNPLGLADTVSTGIVSALDQPVVATGGTGRLVTDAIRTDAAVGPGSSGGPLVDAAGQVVGITSASAGGSFVIPAAQVTGIAHQIIATGSVRHAYLGGTLTDGTVLLDGTRRSAAVFSAVPAGTPAAKAGLRARDAVIAINGRPLGDADMLLAQVRALGPGASVTLTVDSGGPARSVLVPLAARPDPIG
jgi:putative serine protease PepD